MRFFRQLKKIRAAAMCFLVAGALFPFSAFAAEPLSAASPGASGRVSGGTTIVYPAGGAEDLLHQTRVSDSVRSAGTEVPSRKAQVPPPCQEPSGLRHAAGTPGYQRCRKITAIREAPGAPQGAPGTSQTSNGIVIKTHY
jgi:hypothetical protein